MKIWKLAFFPILLLASTSAFSQTFIDGEAYSYNFVKSTCYDAASAFTESYSEAALQTFEAVGNLYMFNAKGVKGLWSRGGLNGKIQLVLDSDALHKALSECYGNDEFMKKMYVLHLIAANDAAIFAGGFAGLGIPKYLQWGARGVSLIWQPISKALISQQILTFQAAKRIGLFTAIGASTVAAAPLVEETYHTIIESRQSAKRQLESDEKDFDSYFSEFQNLTPSQEDQDYKKDLLPEMQAVAHKILTNPMTSNAEKQAYGTKLLLVE